MGPDSQGQMLDKLRQISTVFPGSSYACVLGPEGDILVEMSHREMEQGELPTAISSLKLAAVQFASHLNQNECTVIHVSGDSSMFSCYEVGDNLLAVFCDNQEDTFDMVLKDEQMKSIIEELGLLMQNATVA